MGCGMWEVGSTCCDSTRAAGTCAGAAAAQGRPSPPHGPRCASGTSAGSKARHGGAQALTSASWGLRNTALVPVDTSVWQIFCDRSTGMGPAVVGLSWRQSGAAGAQGSGGGGSSSRGRQHQATKRSHDSWVHTAAACHMPPERA